MNDDQPEKQFSIYSFITSVRNERRDLTPDELAKEVLIRLPQAHERAALEQAIRKLVSDVITKHPSTNRPFLTPVPDQDQPERDSARSWKTNASRLAWAKHLDSPFHVVPGGHEWIAFGDCTVDDLVSGAQVRRDQSAALLVTAEALDEWSALLVKHGVRRVRELPERVLRARLDRSAA